MRYNCETVKFAQIVLIFGSVPKFSLGLVRGLFDHGERTTGSRLIVFNNSNEKLS